MNFYNPLSNVPKNTEAWSTGSMEAIAKHHLTQAELALEVIRKRDPMMADQLLLFVRNMLLAANAYNHDMFQTFNPVNEDVMTRIRKNR